MAEIRKSGLIPSSTGTYATNYNLSDDLVGKYLSLSGARKFYNPGTDLSLSSPSSGATTNTISAISSSTPSHQGAVIKSNTNGDTAFVGYPDTSWGGDSIPGLVTRGYIYEDHSNSEGHLLNEDSVHPQAGTTKVINILTPGTYVFKCIGSGDSEWSTTQDFNFDFVWCLNVNGIELNMTPILGQAHAAHVGGGVGWLGKLFWTIDNYVSPAFTLNTGDYVQMYCKSIAAYKQLSATYTVNNLALTVELTTSAPPSQSTFTNPLNIADFKTNSINLYGGGRDTLVLQGTKLTNI